MCGIIVARALTNDPVNHLVWGQFERQKSRGTEGFGVFDGKFIFKTPKLKKMRGWLRNKKHHNDFLMFHHRMPTSTINVKRAAHPFSTGDYFGDVRYVLIHNGHVSNSVKLKLEHEAIGIEYTSELDDGSFNDSESLLWDVALTLEGHQEKLTAYGGIAFVAAKLVNDEITHLFFAKNLGRPLNLYRGKEGILLSSEGEGEGIKDDELYTYNYQANRLTHKYFKVPSFAPYNPDWGRDYYSAPYSSSSQNYCGNSYQVPRTMTASQKFDSLFDENGDPYERSWWENEPEFFVSGDGDTDDLLVTRRASEYNIDAELLTEEREHDWFLYDYLETDTDEVTVDDTFDHYMRQSNGVYEHAYDLVDTDLSYFIAHHRTPKRNVIVEVLQETLDKILNHDGYVDDTSVHEDYFLPVRVEPKKQAALMPLHLIGAGQEG